MGLFGAGTLAYASLQSTNKEAAILIAEGSARHGTVVLAHEQTEGRGQRGSRWLSQAGKDLTFSIVLEPVGMRADGQFRLVQLAALAVQQALSALLPGKPPAVKWPNDVLVGDRKVCGILIKADLIGELVTSAVAGIGVNVNGTELPEALMATSLKLETGRDHDVLAVLDAVLAAFDRAWNLPPEELSMEYRSKLWGMGRWCPMVLDGQVVELRPIDVDGSGRLLVEQCGGVVAAYGTNRLRYAGR